MMNKSPLLLYRPVCRLFLRNVGPQGFVFKRVFLDRLFMVFLCIFLWNPLVAAKSSGVQFFVNAPKVINEGDPVSIEIRADQP